MESSEPEVNVLAAPEDPRLVDGRRDIAIPLLSFGGAALLAALAVLGSPLFARITRPARGPDLVIWAGVIVSAAGFLLFAWMLTLRYRRGWRDSFPASALTGALGVGGLIASLALLLESPTGEQQDASAVPFLLTLGALVCALGLGVAQGRRWARFVLAAAAALASIALGLFAVDAIISMGELVHAAVLVAALAPAILILAALCMRSAGRIFPGSGRTPKPEGILTDRNRLFASGSRLAIVCFVLLWAFLTAAAPVNLTRAAHRSRQRKTLNRVRAMATAVEAYAADHKAYPDAKTIEELAKLVEPEYIQRLPRTDGWGWPLEYTAISKPENGETRVAREYLIRSPGRDGVYEQKDPTAYKSGAVPGFDRDIVFANDSYLQWPEPAIGR